MENFVNIGKSVKRVDAFEKVTGTALYLDDLKFPGLLHGKVLRSPYAHARILSVDTKEAERLPGVKAVVTGKEFAKAFNNPVFGGPIADQPFLAYDKVRFVGEAVAAVAAVSEEIAEDALDLIKVEYEELPNTLNVEDSMKNDAPLVHDNCENYRYPSGFKAPDNNNVCHYIEVTNGDIEQGFKESDYIFEDTFTHHNTHHVPMECRVAIGQFNLNDNITIYASDQSPYGILSNIVGGLKLPEAKVRVITPSYIGGGFGGKLRGSGLMPIVPIAWKAKNTPVKLSLTREEEFTATTTRHASKVILKTGVKKDGTIIARHAKLYFDTGAYADRGPTVLEKGVFGCIGPYKVPHVKVEAYALYTNKVPSGAYRGYGTPQVTWAFDSQMDIIADKLKIDPVEIRLKNLVDEGYIMPVEKVDAHAVGLGECIVKSMEIIKKKSQETEGDKNKIKRGIGLGCGYKISRTPSGCNALIKVNSDFSADIYVSSIEMGQGVNTIFSQIVADELSIPFEKIRVLPADTEVTPFFPATTSSRTTFFLGNALKRAAEDIKRQLLNIAKDKLEVSKEDLIMENGFIYSENDHDKRVSVEKLVKETYKGGINVLGRGTFYHYFKHNMPPYVKLDVPPTHVWMYGAEAVKVDVNIETGRVKIVEVSAVMDVGKAINPLNCEGQIEGGVVHAIGNAMYEKLNFNNKGMITNTSLLDYKIPSAMDMPEINTGLVEYKHREGPYGAKGVGEIVVVPTSAAIANAIYNAVGVRIKDLPITPDAILEALKNKDIE